jgi:hypothetical protein
LNLPQVRGLKRASLSAWCITPGQVPTRQN